MSQSKLSYLEKVESGICVTCGKPHNLRRVRCPECLAKNAVSCMKQKIKRVEENRCVECGRPKIYTGFGTENKTCMNCSAKEFRSLVWK